ncbi:NAD(P)-binding protein [Fistulina hepatica ATCC 64428]|uniref:NAD(P)-binding protein n=1 Tax=Fistulina hepatica ATCC 64428 TaxID=1128425 RepID=A0A0D7AHR8_9AGAR|nr:NAD(P)-binding protein [Fistulina hepatica ATCC 64428]
MPNTSLSGKVALVTGSSRGIGSQIALELASRGADVVINFLSSAGLAERVVADIKALGRRSVAIQANVANINDIKRLFEEAVTHMGGLDIVVSSSGVEYFGHISEVTPEDYDKVFSINTRGQFFVAQQAYKHLRTGGRLVFMSSISAQAKVGKHAIYAGSKAAVEAFVRSLAQDFGDKQITVNAIAPAGVKSDMYEAYARHYFPGGEKFTDEEVDQANINMQALKRVGYPEDVSRVVAFLVSEDGGWVDGQTITISGGARM